MDVVRKEMRIRPLDSRDDFESYISLMNELSPSIDVDRVNKEMWISFISNLSEKHQVWVIERDDSVIIGSGTILIEPKVLHNFQSAAHIEDIVVAREYQNQGLGKKLIHHLIEVARRHDCYKIILDCKDELEPFYSRSGLTRRGIQMALYLTDRLH